MVDLDKVFVETILDAIVIILMIMLLYTIRMIFLFVKAMRKERLLLRELKDVSNDNIACFDIKFRYGDAAKASDVILLSTIATATNIITIPVLFNINDKLIKFNRPSANIFNRRTGKSNDVISMFICSRLLQYEDISEMFEKCIHDEKLRLSTQDNQYEKWIETHVIN